MSKPRSCPHCGGEHPRETPACPKTGKPMERGASGLPKLRPFAMQTLDDDTKAGPPKPSLRRPAHSGPLALLGTTIDGKYRIKRVLGAGGMGTVYDAENVLLGRPVAIKVLVRNAADPAGAKRFAKEARATGSLTHPHICQVYDFGTTETGALFLVMEKLVGETLAERVAREHTLPIDEACTIIADVLDGLGEAHRHNVLHRDVKPENVFLAKIGGEIVVKILDFGIAKSIRRSGTSMDTLTQVGTILGTPHYMAPEQASGRRDLDARVDLYACGVMLYELLTGKRPFAAPLVNDILLQILRDVPIGPRTYREDIPPDLERIVLYAMRKDREDRFRSAAEFSAALREIARSGTLSSSAAAGLHAPRAEAKTAPARPGQALDMMRTIEDPPRDDLDPDAPPDDRRR